MQSPADHTVSLMSRTQPKRIVDVQLRYWVLHALHSAVFSGVHCSINTRDLHGDGDRRQNKNTPKSSYEMHLVLPDTEATLMFQQNYIHRCIHNVYFSDM